MGLLLLKNKNDPKKEWGGPSKLGPGLREEASASAASEWGGKHDGGGVLCLFLVSFSLTSRVPGVPENGGVYRGSCQLDSCMSMQGPTLSQGPRERLCRYPSPSSFSPTVNTHRCAPAGLRTAEGSEPGVWGQEVECVGPMGRQG